MSANIYISAAPADLATAKLVATAAKQLGLTVAPAGAPGAAQNVGLVIALWSRVAADDVRVPLEAPLAAYRSALLLARLDATPVPAEQRRFALDVSHLSDPAARLAAIMKRICDMLDLPLAPLALGDLIVAEASAAEAQAEKESPAEIASAPSQTGPTPVVDFETLDAAAPRDPAMFVIRPVAEEELARSVVSPPALALVAAAMGMLLTSLTAWWAGMDQNVTKGAELAVRLVLYRIAPLAIAFGVAWSALRLVPSRDGRKRMLRIAAVVLLGLLLASVAAAGLGTAMDALKRAELPWFSTTSSLEGVFFGIGLFLAAGSAVTVFLLIGLGLMRGLGTVAPHAPQFKVALLIASMLLVIALIPSFDSYRNMEGPIEARVETELARVGWRVESSIDGGTNLPARIRAFQSANGLVQTGVADDALLDQLEQQPDKREWRVRADGSGDSPSITDVLNRRGLDATIDVGPGVYRECIGINTPGYGQLVIRGAGDSTVILCDGDVGISGQNGTAGTGAPLRKDVFAEAADASDKAMAMDITASTDEPADPYLPAIFTLYAGDRLERLTIRQTSTRVSGTTVRLLCNKGTEVDGRDCNDTPPTMTDVTIDNVGKGWAVEVSGDIRPGRATAVIRNARIGGGLWLAEKTNPLVERTTFLSRRGMIALWLAENEATIRSSDFPHGASVHAMGAGGTLVDCTFTGTPDGTSISVVDNGKLTIVRARFAGFVGNATPIWANGRARVRISDSVFDGVGQDAILLLGRSHGEVLDNRFTNIGKAAVSVGGTASAQIQRNRFSGIREAAIFTYGQATGTIANNDVRESASANFYAIGIDKESRFKLGGNRIDTPNRPCLGITGNAQADVSGNIFAACDGFAIEYARADRVRIGENLIADGSVVKLRDP